MLLALCKTAPNVQSGQSAQRLTYQLTPYILEAPIQSFAPSPFFRKIDPSPTEALTFNVTGALLALGLNYSDLQEAVTDSIWSFLNTCTRAADHAVSSPTGENVQLQDAMRTLTIVVALLGFLDAASAQTDFWKAGGRLALIRKVRHLLSEPFLISVETALSTIRNSHSHDRAAKEWRRIVRHYAELERPLGAMLLQRSFMYLVVSSTSLMVADAGRLRNAHILDILMSRGAKLLNGVPAGVEGDSHSLEVFAALAAEQMNFIEAGADFVRMGTPSQQKLACAVKASALVAFLNCSLLYDEVADADTIFTWLQETIEDPFQMADDTLASVVLRSLALLCYISPAFASPVSRLLPRFLVQSVPHGDTVTVTSNCLAFVLKSLSKDAVISTLYSLGNVLSPEPEAVLTDGQANGSAGEPGVTSVYAQRNTMESAISLRINGEDENIIAYGNVIQAICGIAEACQDEKITALAQSMLLQKLEKVNASADSQIIIGAAKLSLTGAQLEFRALLKMYTRLCQIGIVDNKDFVLAAVSALAYLPIQPKIC